MTTEACDILLTTDVVSEDSRNAYFQMIFSPIVNITPINESHLYGRFQVRKVQDLILLNIEAGAYQYERSRDLVSSSNLDMYLLSITLEGQYIYNCTTNSGSSNIEVGDIILIDLTKSFHGVSYGGKYLSIYIPKSLLIHQLDGYRICQDIILKANKPMTKILKDYMLGLFDVALRLKEKEASVTIYTLLSLLITALRGAAPQSLLELNEKIQGAEVLKGRVLHFIDLNIEDPHLNVELLMKTFRVSRAHLYRAFDEDNGVITVIRNKRLDIAYRELLNPINKKSVTQIAHECGFKSSNQFYRVFRQRFGFAPNEIRLKKSRSKIYVEIGKGLYNHFKNLATNSVME
ncbi:MULTISPECIES: helix-turn-helix domain-containing protein [Acinetobacter]|uniref:helix-turn-helix domain-containing protein n=1 Tax=Acinetobacter TaxID=469 RepID=UPI00138ADB2A|nr:helix-turn-helix domain-containing protein [Acinetobacter sp. WC-141]